MLLYSIDGPTLRDRLMARRPNQLRPIAVITKIIRVESAEVVYHDVVIAEREDHDSGKWYKSEYLEWSREALERSIGQTVVDLQRAFQSFFMATNGLDCQPILFTFPSGHIHHLSVLE